jgi:hypothetical protein
VGHYLTPGDVRARFVEPLNDIAKDFQKTYDRWMQASRNDAIAREDLYLNDVTAEMSLAALRKLQREIAGKLDDAIAGIYRYRETERSIAAGERRRRKIIG